MKKTRQQVKCLARETHEVFKIGFFVKIFQIKHILKIVLRKLIPLRYHLEHFIVIRE